MHMINAFIKPSGVLMKNKFTLATLVAVTALFMLSGCERNNRVFEYELNALGTFVQISIVGQTTETARTAAITIEEDLLVLDSIGYTFELEGELRRLNEAIRKGQSMEVSDTLVELISNAGKLSSLSEGMFNPATGQLTAFWEFHCDKDECDESPYPDEVQRLVNEHVEVIISQKPSIDDLVIKGNRVSSRNRLVKLEFADIIRGVALDKGIERLAALGVTNAMIDIGGNVRTIGTRGDHDWWIGIPGRFGKELIASLENIDDKAVVTVRAFDHSAGKLGRVYRHIVDPRTGLPVKDIQSVTVTHKSAVVASAAATALLIAGIRDWKMIADKMDIHEILMITKDGTIYTSTAMAHVIHWKQGMQHQYLVSGS